MHHSTTPNSQSSLNAHENPRAGKAQGRHKNADRPYVPPLPRRCTAGCGQSQTGTAASAAANSPGRSRSNSGLQPAPPAQRSKTWGAHNHKKASLNQHYSVAPFSPASGGPSIESDIGPVCAPIRRARSYSSGVDTAAVRARVCNSCVFIYEAAASAGVQPPALHWSTMPQIKPAETRGAHPHEAVHEKSRSRTQQQRRGLSFAGASDSVAAAPRMLSPSAFVSAATSGLNSAGSSADESDGSGQNVDTRRPKQDAARGDGASTQQRNMPPPAHVLGRYLVSGAKALSRHGSGSSRRSRGGATPLALRSTSQRDSSGPSSPISVAVFAMSADSDAEGADERIRRAGSGGGGTGARTHRTSEDSAVWPLTMHHVSNADDALFTRSSTQPSAPPSPPTDGSPTFAGRYSRAPSSERTSAMGYLGEDTSDPDTLGLHMFGQMSVFPQTGAAVVVLPGVRPINGIARLGTPPTPERVLSGAISLSSGKDGAGDAEFALSLNLETGSDAGAEDIGGPSMLQRAVSTESCDEGAAGMQVSGHMDPTPPDMHASPLRCRTGPQLARHESRFRSLSNGLGGGRQLALPSQPIGIPLDKTELLFAVDREGNRTSAGLRTRRLPGLPGPGDGTAAAAAGGLLPPATVVRRHRTDMGPRATSDAGQDLGAGYFEVVDEEAARQARFREKRAEVSAANMQVAFAAGVLPAPAERQPTAEYTTTFTCSNCKNVFAPALSGFQHYCSRDCHTMATLHGVSSLVAP